MVDWWALGIVVYQMLYTFSPFKIPNQANMPREEQFAENKKRILTQEEFEWPEKSEGSWNESSKPINVSDKLKDFIK